MSKKTEEKSDSEDVDSKIVVATTSIVWSPKRHLFDILSYCDLRDLGNIVCVTCVTWEVASSSLHGVWVGALNRCYPSVNQPPRWLRNSPQPKRVLTDLSYSAHIQGREEEKRQSVVLSIPKSTANEIERWKEDVVQNSEEVGVKNFCRWDLIDAVKDETAIRYSWQFFGSDVYFTAFNTAASRLGVTSCYMKTWIRDGGAQEGEAQEGGEEEIVNSKIVVLANIDAESYTDYIAWQKRSGTMKRNSLLPQNTYDGSVVFEVLPAVGPPGRAVVDYHRI